MRLRRKRPASSVEPDRLDAAAEVLERWATRGSAQSVLYRYKREARQRQKAKAGAKAPPAAEPRNPASLRTHTAPPPQPRAETVSTTEAAPDPEAVPSAPSTQGPAAKTSDEWAYEHFLAFETLCGNGDRIAERIEEARAYEPDDTPPEYVW